MRIVVHDYAGHPFQVQLARTLAARGHDVLHLHAAELQTPKGPLKRVSDDPPTFKVEALHIGQPHRKYNLVRRLAQDRRYGAILADRIAVFGPDVVLSSNSPLDAQAALQRQTHRGEAAFVFWIQDVYSTAIARALKRQLPGLGRLITEQFVRIERRLLRRSDAVVAITADFLPLLEGWGVQRDRISVIENWAPLHEVTPLPKTNPWALEHGLSETPVFLYAGTLGLKHDPTILLDLAKELPNAKVVVISEGLGAGRLSQGADAHPNLLLLPYQPFERLSEVLASADVLVAILEAEAGAYSVPSKVLTYLAAGRPILGSIPAANLAARTIRLAGAGSVLEPGDRLGFLAAARGLLEDPVHRSAMANSGRTFAEANFAIDPIGDRFELVLRDAVRARSRLSRHVPAPASDPPAPPRPKVTP